MMLATYFISKCYRRERGETLETSSKAFISWASSAFDRVVGAATTSLLWSLVTSSRARRGIMQTSTNVMEKSPAAPIVSGIHVFSSVVEHIESLGNGAPCKSGAETYMSNASGDNTVADDVAHAHPFTVALKREHVRASMCAPRASAATRVPSRVNTPTARINVADGPRC